MGCCFGKSTRTRESPNARVPLRSAPPPGHTPVVVAQYRPPPQPTRCEICSSIVDPALLDSHREACRANHKRSIRTAQDEAQANAASRGTTPQARPANHSNHHGAATVVVPPPLIEELSEEEACVICIEKARVYAFVPCGHLAVCKQCAPQLDTCPVCRGPREGLLFVEQTHKLCVCKHCKHVIGPTFFDAHREVCALRMRQNKEREASPEALEAEKKLCVQCRARPKNCAFIPCGHFLYCTPCAASTSQCPQCCADVKSTMPMFEA